MYCLTVLTSLVSYKGTCSANFGTNFQCTYGCMEVAQDYQVAWFRSISVFRHCLETNIFKLFGVEKERLTLILLYFRPALADNWYSLSYLYFSTLGTLVTVVVGIIISLLTGTSFRAVIERVSDLFQTKTSWEPEEVPITYCKHCVKVTILNQMSSPQHFCIPLLNFAHSRSHDWSQRRKKFQHIFKAKGQKKKERKKKSVFPVLLDACRGWRFKTCPWTWQQLRARIYTHASRRQKQFYFEWVQSTQGLLSASMECMHFTTLLENMPKSCKSSAWWIF